MEALLDARGFIKNLNMTPLDEYHVWTKDSNTDNKVFTLRIASNLFTGPQNLLKYVNVNDWTDSLAVYEVSEMRTSDELPF